MKALLARMWDWYWHNASYISFQWTLQQDAERMRRYRVRLEALEREQRRLEGR